MRITVTGAGGYVGSRLVPALLEQGHAVAATFTDPRSASRFWWADRVRVVRLDVRDRSSVVAACEGADALYYKAENLMHREHLKNKVCPTCLSPCQVNVGAMKQFVPYAKFLVRAYQVKRDTDRHLETLPATR